MPERRRDDEQSFGADALARLKLAAEEAAWISGRGYALSTVLDLVGAQHRLAPRQRAAVERGICSDAQYKRHVVRELETDDVPRRPLLVDARDLVTVVGAVLECRPVVQCLDGVIRALPGPEGDDVLPSDPGAAIDRIGKALAELRPSKTRWLLDERLAPEGALAERFSERAAGWKIPAKLELVADARAVLRDAQRVATSDAAVLDECASWFNLAGHVVSRIDGAWILRLQ